MVFFDQEEDFPGGLKMSLIASQSVDVAQLKDALSKLRTNPSKLTMLMQQVNFFA
jgi:hypothetical protein